MMLRCARHWENLPGDELIVEMIVAIFIWGTLFICLAGVFLYIRYVRELVQLSRRKDIRIFGRTYDSSWKVHQDRDFLNKVWSFGSAGRKADQGMGVVGLLRKIKLILRVQVFFVIATCFAILAVAINRI